ncbi:MAG: sugar ABC transporter permease, partial [Mesorhizobium sp.]
MQPTATIHRLKAAGAPPRLSAFAQWADRHFKWLLVAPAVLLILALSI